MTPASNTLKAILSSLVPRKENKQTLSPARRDAGYSLSQSSPSRLSPALGTLNHDVLRLIALELYRSGPEGLKPLASCSRTLRALLSPVLFSRCRRPSQLYPPEAIRPFVRYLTYTSSPSAVTTFTYFAHLLDCFPFLFSVSFERFHELPWSILSLCFSRPRITSISFDHGADLTGPDSTPSEEVDTASLRITRFLYDVRLWRDMDGWINPRLPPSRRNRDLLISRESQSLSALVPQMNHTLTQLLLPMESAPIVKMAQLSWSKLRELSISGLYWTSEQVESLPILLGALPRLEKLSVRIRRELYQSEGRPPILGQHSTPRSVLSGMHSLTVAYPNPDDDIFIIDTSRLRHLSICDWPRHYNSLIYRRRYSPRSAYPILSSAECLSVLRRMDLPTLSSLELVYLTSESGTDDDLLRYVATAFPQLSHLELHRYRANRKEEVDYEHIAEVLTAARSLRRVRLNLDFPDDHGPYCNEYEVRTKWRETFEEQYGPEITKIMEKCPELECVELLYHGIPRGTWAEFHPSRCATPRFVLEYDAEHMEPPLMPYKWYDLGSMWRPAPNSMMDRSTHRTVPQAT
ncbi:hypothetical protein OH76DRAFT_1400310 [Lentinus brumalis]|uniref:F-box domain-containing protein n=1 Tax=Lentinus brumalis TaxID=2498619 RepID=A0A371DJ42_9APHY|nr:hypothetical protein OH76DRAFT_1400310 [Polyporus brumalis]